MQKKTYFMQMLSNGAQLTKRSINITCMKLRQDGSYKMSSTMNRLRLLNRKLLKPSILYSHTLNWIKSFNSCLLNYPLMMFYPKKIFINYGKKWMLQGKLLDSHLIQLKNLHTSSLFPQSS